jgi:glycosyltransferase involved in cell wall biosynthesis
MKISFSPFESKDNKYVDIMLNIIQSIEGIEVYPFVWKKFFLFSNNIWSADIVWLNWYETNTGTLKGILKITVLFLLKKLNRKKIIYTLHNKKPHDLRKTCFLKLFQNSIYYFSDIIVIHSKLSEQEISVKYRQKIQYIPHPNYIEEYGSIIANEQTNTKLNLLFWGQIRPYKNIELLINAVSQFSCEEVELTIAGSSNSQEYQRKIMNLIKHKNIKSVFKFIDNDEINVFISPYDLLILPYDTGSSLNSGMVILSFSYSKTVICPNIGTISDMENKKFLSYTYSNKKEHIEKLVKQIQKAIDLKRSNINIFNEWGKIMFEEVKVNNSKEKVRKLIEKIIK